MLTKIKALIEKIKVTSIYPPDVSPKQAKLAQIFGALSILICSFSFCCAFSAPWGLCFSIFGLSKNKKNILCIIGTVLCAVVTIYFLVEIISTLRDPEAMKEMMDAVNSMMASTSDAVSAADSVAAGMQ